MDNITSQPAHLRLAIAPGVSSSQLSALLALQRAEEPEVSITFFEVAGDELLDGLREGRYDVECRFKERAIRPWKPSPCGLSTWPLRYR